jgi:universal stress protein A
MTVTRKKSNPDSRSSTQGDLRFRHILVPTDLTERTEKALHLAGKLASPAKTRVTLVHVVETIDGFRFDELKPFYKRLERKARTRMSAFIHRAPIRAADVAIAVVFGRRAESVIGFAKTHRVDLIVLASHRVKSATPNRDWGTISYRVGILAECPVLLVK